jgi:cell division septal protein FtsQ
LSSRQRKLSEYLQSSKSQKKFKIPNPFASLKQLVYSVGGLPSRILSVTGIVPLYIVVSTIISMMIFFGYSFFTIQKIIVIKDTPGDFPLKNTNQLIGQSMILQSERSMQDILKKSNPDTALITVTKVFPQTLKINVHPARSVLSIYINDSQYILLDSDAKVVKIVFEPVSELPILTYYQKLVSTDYEIGSRIAYSDIRASAQIATVLSHYGYTGFTIQIDDTARIDVNWKDTHLILSNKSDIVRQIASLDEFMRVLTRTTEQYKKVDFRFDRVITEK